MKKICIVGGGASGLACATFLARAGYAVTLLERGARLGKKLSSTGNGQGNVTNLDMRAEKYHSDDKDKVKRALDRFGAAETISMFEDMGGVFLPDERGRVYPASRQASAVTDLFRREIARLGVAVLTDAKVTGITFDKNFTVIYEGGKVGNFDAVVLCAGGKAAPNFGTDGMAYALAKSFGHSISPLSPVLVRLRTEKDEVRGLRGIRVDGLLRVVRRDEEIYRCRGDVLFTDVGVSGDAVFRASSYAKEGDTLLVDLLPDVDEGKLLSAIKDGEDGLLCVVNNGLAREIGKRARTRREKAALIKAFPLTVTGTLGFDYAQATRGGIMLAEVDDDFMSKKRAGLYFAGEILNVDGECGGYNLQWAFSSAYCVTEGIKRAYPQ